MNLWDLDSSSLRYIQHLILKLALPNDFKKVVLLASMIGNMSSLREITITVSVDASCSTRKLKRSMRSIIVELESDCRPFAVNLHVLGKDNHLPTKTVLTWLKRVPQNIQIRTLKVSFSDMGSRHHYTTEFISCLQDLTSLTWKDAGHGHELCSRLAKFPHLQELDLCKSDYSSGERMPVPYFVRWNLGKALTRLYVPLALFQMHSGSFSTFDSVRFLYLDTSLLEISNSVYIGEVHLPFRNLDSLRFVVTADLVDLFCKLVQANPYLTRLATGFVSISQSRSNALMCRAASVMGCVEHLEIGSPLVVDLGLLLRQALPKLLTLKVPEFSRNSLIHTFRALQNSSTATDTAGCPLLTSIRGYRFQSAKVSPGKPENTFERLFLLVRAMPPRALSWIRNSEQPFEKRAPNVMINVRELRLALITIPESKDEE